MKQLRIFPALAIARFGSSPEPLDNYTVGDPGANGFRALAPAETLRVNAATGEISAAETPPALRFRDAAGAIKPVCPFFEVWVQLTDGADFEPLTTAHLTAAGLGPEAVRWRLRAGNRKVTRRTGREQDAVLADTGDFSDHTAKPLLGRGTNLKAGKSIPFGSVRYLRPTAAFPEVRLRFTPSRGKVYGPKAGDPNTVDDVYNAAAGRWVGFRDSAPPPGAPASTQPGGIYAHARGSRASLGYLDDSCDGIIEVQITPLGSPVLRALARVTVGPPAFAPDSWPIRSLADELEQIVLGPAVQGAVPGAEARAIVRHALETIRLMNTDEMNTGGMAFHDTGFDRAAEPIFPPTRARYANVTQIHQLLWESLAGLDAAPGTPERADAIGTLEQMAGILRDPAAVAELGNPGRRRMPGMMRGSDGRHLALTHRQIDKVQKVLDQARLQPGPLVAPAPATTEADMIKLIQRFASFAPRHNAVPAAGGTLAALFANPPQLLQHLRTQNAQTDEPTGILGTPLVVPGRPDDSAFFKIINDPNHPMNSRFAQVVPVVNKTGIEIARAWIESLAPAGPGPVI